MPDKIHCAHILVKTESEVKKILERLDKGEKFANIAKQVSLCPSGKRGGRPWHFWERKDGQGVRDSCFCSTEGSVFSDCEDEVWLSYHKKV